MFFECTFTLAKIIKKILAPLPKSELSLEHYFTEDQRKDSCDGHF